MEKEQALIIIVDDDPSVRKSMARLLKTAGYVSVSFGSAEEFFSAALPDADSSCLVLDLNLPDLNGLDLQVELQTRDYCMPIVFISGCGDIPASVKAMKQGAIDFLTKPVDEQILIRVLEEALQQDRERRADLEERHELEQRLQYLTPREYEVMRFVIAGLLNKQIAYELGITEKTVKVHRGQVMSKLAVSSVAELTRLAEKAGISPAEPRS